MLINEFMSKVETAKMLLLIGRRSRAVMENCTCILHFKISQISRLFYAVYSAVCSGLRCHYRNLPEFIVIENAYHDAAV